MQLDHDFLRLDLLGGWLGFYFPRKKRIVDSHLDLNNCFFNLATSVEIVFKIFQNSAPLKQGGLEGVNGQLILKMSLFNGLSSASGLPG